MSKRAISLMALMIAAALAPRVYITVQTAIEVLPIPEGVIQFVDLEWEPWFTGAIHCRTRMCCPYRSTNARPLIGLYTFGPGCSSSLNAACAGPRTSGGTLSLARGDAVHLFSDEWRRVVVERPNIVAINQRFVMLRASLGQVDGPNMQAYVNGRPTVMIDPRRC